MFAVALLVVILVSRLAFFPAHADDAVPADPGSTGDALMTTQTTTSDGANGGDPLPVLPGDGLPGTAAGTDTTVTTGGATATLEAGNTVNTNVGSAVPGGDAPTDESGGVGTTTVDFLNENDGTVLNTGTTTATTGENVAGGLPNGQAGEGNVTILSGDAVATANVFNMVNTNVFNSSGFVAFLSNLFGNFQSVDLRSLPVYTDDRADATTCTIFGCGTFNLNANITSSSTASIWNSLFVRAFSGGNTASTTGTGNSLIETGNAYAAANVVNIANTNIVDSNYMMLVFNNFGDWDGDFIFPGQEYFANQFLKNNSSGGENIPITTSSVLFNNANDASVTTNATTTAASGENAAMTGNGTTTVISGDANSTSNVLNRVNQNVYGGTSLAVIFRVHGNWSGNVYSLPPGVVWSETGDGIAFWSDPSYGTSGFDAGGGEEMTTSAVATGVTASTTVDNKNTALIGNNIEVYALTGDNKAESVGGSATIKTGKAYAGSNVVNVANTNLFGTNWILAIIDIFGDWSGNISFGQPDLWLGGWVHSENSPAAPNDPLEYHFTVANRGDTDATNVRLTAHVDDRIVYLADGGTWGNDGIYWDLGDIPRGGSVDVTYKGSVRQHIPFGTTAFTSSASVSAHEPDANPSDNYEEIGSLAAYNEPQQTGPAGVYYTTMPKLQVTKTNNATTTVQAPGMVDYTLTVFNDSTGPAYEGVLIDTLKDENGNVVYEESWNLGEILPHEEINVTYSIEYNATTTSGVYTNYAQVKAYGGQMNPQYASIADSAMVSSMVTIKGVASTDVSASSSNTPTIIIHKDETAHATATPAGIGGIGNALDEDVQSGIGGNGTGASHALVTFSGTALGRRLPKVVDLHPLAMAFPPNDTLASSLWGNQSAAAFAAVLGSPWLYGALIILFLLIVWYEKRSEKV